MYHIGHPILLLVVVRVGRVLSYPLQLMLVPGYEVRLARVYSMTPKDYNMQHETYAVALNCFATWWGVHSSTMGAAGISEWDAVGTCTALVPQKFRIQSR